MKLYAVVYGSGDLSDEGAKFYALCMTLASAKRERARAAAETGEPTGILVFNTESVYKGCFLLDDTIEG